ncbi:Autophagy protein 7 [Sarracenia purpurea var. burkii]
MARWVICRGMHPDVAMIMIPCRTQKAAVLLLFDALVIKSQNVMQQTLVKRYKVRVAREPPRLRLEHIPRSASESESANFCLPVEQWLGDNDINNNYTTMGYAFISESEYAALQTIAQHKTFLVVECVLVNHKLLREEQEAEPEEFKWRITRIRTDKNRGNHETVVKEIIRSIRDGVTVSELLCAIGQCQNKRVIQEVN